MQRGRLGQFDRHHLPRGGVGGRVFRDQDVLAIAAVFGRDQPLPAFVQQTADDGRLAALQDVEHTALGAALAVVAQHTHANAVLVQHAAHLLRRQIDGGVAVVGHDKTVAVAMPFNPAFELAHQGMARGWAACNRFFFNGIFLLFPEAPRWRNW
jgi:hypothetical protein